MGDRRAAGKAPAAQAAPATQEDAAPLERVALALMDYMWNPHIAGRNDHRDGFCLACAAQYLAANVALTDSGLTIHRISELALNAGHWGDPPSATARLDPPITLGV